MSEQAAHSWAYRDNNDGTHDCFCKICGYVESTEPHLSEDGWQNDDGSHWKVCDDCGAVYESESHSLSCTDNGDGSHNEACDICGYVASTASHGSTAGWHKDEGGHWRVCDYCGAEYDRDTHMMDYADNGNGTHSLMCDVCGYVEETATHSSAKWHEGEGRHWKVCDDCGAVFAKAVHDFAYQANTDGTHSLVCRVCGFVKETAAHSSDVWETDGTDRTTIASVIYNRLNNPGASTAGYLQIDATIQYVLPEGKIVQESDYQGVDSPYNTYKNKGLPPGPIANPGMESITAALNPQSTNYYYYALGDDHLHHFFSSYAEHQAFLNS